MKILHVIGSLDAANGGLPVVPAALAAAQSRLGHDVTIASYPLSPGAVATTDTVGGAEAVGRLAIPTGGRLERLRPRAAERWFGKVLCRTEHSGAVNARRPDIMHLHGLWEPVLPAAARAAYAQDVPYALAPHGMLDPWSLGQKRLKKRIALALGYRTVLRRAAFIHALNADEARLIAPLHIDRPVEVIANGVPPEQFQQLPARGAFHAARPVLAGRPYVLFLGRLHYKKGLDHLADAFARIAPRFPDLQLVIAGPDDGARVDFERRTREAGIAGRAHVVGPIYGAEKFSALVDASAFCLPSRQEGFSVAVTEAMGCGVPVVVSDACHFPEVAEAGAGLVVPLDAEAVANALATLIADAPLRERMGSAGRAMVLARFTWPRIAEATIAAYGRALERALRD